MMETPINLDIVAGADGKITLTGAGFVPASFTRGQLVGLLQNNWAITQFLHANVDAGLVVPGK